MQGRCFLNWEFITLLFLLLLLLPLLLLSGHCRVQGFAEFAPPGSRVTVITPAGSAVPEESQRSLSLLQANKLGVRCVLLSMTHMTQQQQRPGLSMVQQTRVHTAQHNPNPQP